MELINIENLSLADVKAAYDFIVIQNNEIKAALEKSHKNPNENSVYKETMERENKIYNELLNRTAKIVIK